MTTSTVSQSKHQSNCLQIFLGGSCNPTTWRQNIAIPYLESNGITYYNPQIDNWTPEVVSVEQNAKQNAQILLFVIDKQTRSTVGLVESSFIAGGFQTLVLVIHPFEYKALNSTELSELMSNTIETTSSLVKTSLSSTNNTSNPFSNTSSSSIATLMARSNSSSITRRDSGLYKSNASSQSACATRKTSIKSKISNDLSYGEECFTTSCNQLVQSGEGLINISGDLISIVEYQELRQARLILQCLVALRKIPVFTGIDQALNYVSHKLSSNQCEFAYGKTIPKSTGLQTSHPMLSEIEQIGYIHHLENSCTTESTNRTPTDVYLSLDAGDPRYLIESSILSSLREKGLTHKMMRINSVINRRSISTTTLTNHKSPVEPEPPDTRQESTETLAMTNVESNDINRYKSCGIITNEVDYDSYDDFTCTTSKLLSEDMLGDRQLESTRSAIQEDIAEMRGSQVVLFVITNKCRGLSIMVLASHFMALFGKNIVLCVQYLEEPCSIGEEILTRNAIADYNRGRVYLSDYATRSQVPVFGTLQEAIECCSRKCGNVDSNKC